MVFAGIPRTHETRIKRTGSSRKQINVANSITQIVATPYDLVWLVFTLFVFWSFGVLGVALARSHRLHVASMAASYTLLVSSIWLPADWQRWLHVLALVLGTIGLINYWAGPKID